MSLFESGSPVVRRLKLGLAASALLVVGGVAGGAIGHAGHPPIQMAPTHVVSIHNLATSDGIVTIKGRVAESFGDRFVIDDGTGRTLIDGGPRDRDGALAPLGSVVLVQGRFDRDAFHAAFLVDPSGTVTPLGPLRGPHHGRHGPDGPDGPGGPDGEGFHGPYQAPPPPAAKPLAPASAG